MDVTIDREEDTSDFLRDMERAMYEASLKLGETSRQTGSSGIPFLNTDRPQGLNIGRSFRRRFVRLEDTFIEVESNTSPLMFM